MLLELFNKNIVELVAVFLIFLLTSTQLQATPTIESEFILQSKERISRTEFNYTYKAKLRTDDLAVQSATAILTSSSSDTKIVDGVVSFGAALADSSVDSSDTFTIQQNRSVAYDSSALGWSLQYPEPSIEVSSVTGNTASYNAIATFSVVLGSQPTADVTIPLSSSDESEGAVQQESLIFTPENWNLAQEVVVKGRNQNVLNGVQDYTIVLAAAQSNDVGYSGFDADDIEMKGVFLYLSEPADSLELIAGLEAIIKLAVVYTGNESLSYSLVDKPDGMTIDINSGLLTWIPPEAQGDNDYEIKAKVTDGVLFSELVFSVSVSPATDLQTTNTATEILVTEDSSLQGLKITSVDTDLSEQIISTIPESVVSGMPSNITRISDIFIFKDNLNGEFTLEVPLSVSDSSQLKKSRLYTYNEEEGTWFSTNLEMKYITNGDGSLSLRVKLYSIGVSPSFVGLLDDLPTGSSGEQSGVATSYDLATGSVSCVFNPESTTDGETTPEHHLCTYDEDKKIKITGYFDDVWKSGTTTFSVNTIASWPINAGELFKTFGVTQFDESFHISLEDMQVMDENGSLTSDCSKKKTFTGGFVRSSEQRKVLHLNSSSCLSGSQEGTSIHEYFHHAQGRMGHNDYNILANDELPIINKLGNKAHWITEALANWVIGEQSPSLLHNYSLPIVLERGVNSSPLALVSFSGEASKQNQYLKYAFWKLVSDSCSFKNTDRIIHMLSVEPESFSDLEHPDPSGITNFIDNLVAFNCDFGVELGNDSEASMLEVLLRYQYESLYKESTDVGFGSNFVSTPYVYSQSDWGEVNSVGLPEAIEISTISSIPAYGAYSIKIKSDTWTYANYDEGHEAVLRVKTGAGAAPLTVSLLTEYSGFSGNGEIDNIPHRYYKTDSLSEYIFNEDELVDYFVTIANPNGISVPIEEIAFEVREKLSPELEVISPANDSNISNRVIAVTGNVPSTAPDVDRVIVDNGGVKTVTTVSGDRSFSADVVAVIGNNTLIVQGYNSSDLTVPLTKEKVINVSGVESTSTGQNALIASRIAVVLRWKTNGTDIDLYSTDKENGTIWYSNKSVSPGFLDYDNTSGYGPEVITYRKTDDAIYSDGKFDIDVHFYGGSTPTAYSLDVIMNETDPANIKVRHYESIQSLPSGSPSQNGPTGSGASRFNDVLSVICNSDRICLIGDIDGTKLSNTATITENATSALSQNYELYQQNTSTYEKCMSELNSVINKSGYVDWQCDTKTGAKIWQ